MAFIPGVGLVQVTMRFSQADGELAENVFGVDTGIIGGVALDELTAIAQAFADWFTTGDGSGHSYKAMLSSDAALLDVIARDLTTETSLEAFVAPDTSGTDGGVALPNGQSFTVTARSGEAGRSKRGRTFLLGLTRNFLDPDDANLADGTHANNAVLAFNALITAVATVDASQLVVMSRVHDGAPRVAILATPIAVYGYHDLFMDYQRRRAPGHNRHH